MVPEDARPPGAATNAGVALRTRDGEPACAPMTASTVKKCATPFASPGTVNDVVGVFNSFTEPKTSGLTPHLTR